VINIYLLICLLNLIRCSYQIMVLELIVQQLVDRKNTNWSQHMHEVKEGQILGIDAPTGLDLSESTEYASQAALWGIEVVIIALPGS
jgi:hypothetical protein